MKLKTWDKPGDKVRKKHSKTAWNKKYRAMLIENSCSYELNFIFHLHAAIDGDGMIVALSFVGGRVHLRTRFVMSKHRAHEQEERKYLYRGQMGTHPNGIIKDTVILLKNLLTLQWPRLRYRNPSNTNVFYWGGKVCYDCEFREFPARTDQIIMV